MENDKKSCCSTKECSKCGKCSKVACFFKYIFLLAFAFVLVCIGLNCLANPNAVSSATACLFGFSAFVFGLLVASARQCGGCCKSSCCGQSCCTKSECKDGSCEKK
ncbi:MAG: hypothetical protein QM528_07290 [Phycisphaerales bacterium]|nr:hypothetical protein [Phycisphaerales bacterium]